MTPKRSKWWTGLSNREKYLRLKINSCKNHIKCAKKNLNNDFFRKVNSALYKVNENYIIQKAKDKIAEEKIYLVTFKRELEHGDGCCIGRFIVEEARDGVIYACKSCNHIIPFGEAGYSYKFCPYCGRLIKNRKDYY